MDKFLIRRKRPLESNVESRSVTNEIGICAPIASDLETLMEEDVGTSTKAQTRNKADIDVDIVCDPGLRKPINDYDFHVRDEVRSNTLTIEVLSNIFTDGTYHKDRGTIPGLVQKMESYQFIFIAHLMKKLLGMTNALSQFLQKKNQNIMEAVSLIRNTKRMLLDIRENGWSHLVEDVNKFCFDNEVQVLNMEDEVQGRFRLRRDTSTNGDHFRIDIYYQVIDRVCQEMDNRFSESSTELLSYIGCLDPKNAFSNFNVAKIIELAKLYPQDFSKCDLMELEEELKTWIYEMRENEAFSILQDIGEVAKKMIETGYYGAYPLVYRIIELILVLPVATASVERAFSAMKIIKTHLRNKIGDDFLNDSLVCYIERDVFKMVENETIMQYFQNMRTRKLGLPPIVG